MERSGLEQGNKGVFDAQDYIFVQTHDGYLEDVPVLSL